MTYNGLDEHLEMVNKNPIAKSVWLKDKIQLYWQTLLFWFGVKYSLEKELEKVSKLALTNHRIKKPRFLGARFYTWRENVRIGELLLQDKQPLNALPYFLGAQKAIEGDVLLLATIAVTWRELNDHVSAHSFITRARDFCADSQVLKTLEKEIFSNVSKRKDGQNKNTAQQPIHIGILTYNALSSTKMCINSLRTTATLNHSIYVFDNQSQKDETREWLQQKNYPLNVHLNDQNLGVPGGRNGLTDWILKHAGDDDLILFIDNDIEFFPGWDLQAVEIFKRYPEVGLLSADGHRIRLKDKTRKLIKKSCRFGRIDTGCGYYFWVRAKVLRQIGGFDENLGIFWHEDDDFTIHVLANGFEALSLPETPILHRAHQSGEANKGIKEGGSLKNQGYLCKKWRDMNMVNRNNRIRRLTTKQVVKQQGRDKIAGERFIAGELAKQK